MSALEEKLKSLNIYNNHNLLRAMGRPGDVVVHYTPAPDGLMGVGCPSHTSVWSIYRTEGLQRGGSLGSGPIWEKEFLGQRSVSWFPALEFATKLYGGQTYVPSPFGGYIPLRLRQRAEQRKRYWRYS